MWSIGDLTDLVGKGLDALRLRADLDDHGTDARGREGDHADAHGDVGGLSLCLEGVLLAQHVVGVEARHGDMTIRSEKHQSTEAGEPTEGVGLKIGWIEGTCEDTVLVLNAHGRDDEEASRLCVAKVRVVGATEVEPGVLIKLGGDLDTILSRQKLDEQPSVLVHVDAVEAGFTIARRVAVHLQ